MYIVYIYAYRKKYMFLTVKIREISSYRTFKEFEKAGTDGIMKKSIFLLK